MKLLQTNFRSKACQLGASILLVSLCYVNALSQCSFSHNPHNGATTGCDGTGYMTLKFTTRVTGCNPLPCSEISHEWYTHPTNNTTTTASTSKSLCDGTPDNIHTTEKSVNGDADYWVQTYRNGMAIGERYHVSGRVSPPVDTFGIKMITGYRNPFCDGTVVTMEASGGANYQWYRQVGDSWEWVSSRTTFPTTEAGTYKLEGTSYCGEPRSRISAPLVFVPRAGNASLSTGASFCYGPQKTSTASAEADNASSFTWSITGSGNTIRGQAMTTDPHTGKKKSNSTVNFNDSFVGTATITVTSNGCQGPTTPQTGSITVHPVPQANITPAEPLITCGDDSVRVNALPGLNYEWYYNGLRQVSQTGRSMDAYKTGKYSLRVISNAGCNSAFNNFNVRNDYEVNPSLLCDEVLNSVETTTFDEYTAPYSNTKAYFDFKGKAIQSQVRTYESPAIFATQTLNDWFERPVLSTLPAPTLYPQFKYKHLFVENESSTRYSVSDFDSPSTIYDPAPVGDNVPGTLGWYYSGNNNVEDHVPVTDFPYSRIEFYEDGTGEVKKSASPGDSHRMGTGHEIVTGAFPVHSELDNYGERLIELTSLLGNRALSKGIQSVARDENGEYAISITDKEGHTVMTARKGSLNDHVLAVNNEIRVEGDIESPLNHRSTYFYLLEPTPVTIVSNGSFAAEDLINGIKKPGGQTFENADGNWPAGFYRIWLIDYRYNITVSYTTYFKDISYQFYDDAGRLRYSVSPNGCDKWLSGTATFATIDKTEYQYNHQGWLLKVTEPDAGMTEYVYRKDGNIRFSQNAKQRTANTFSYTNYDEIGRPVESGQYSLNTVQNFSSLQSYLEGQRDNWMNNWEGTKEDWIKTYFDDPDEDFQEISNTTLTQSFVLNAVSRTQNENITTWYSYDEQGRVTWMAQKPEMLPVTFVTEYTYDFLGNVLTVANSSYNALGDQENKFYYHYEYDKDKRLQSAYTSNDGVNKQLRAKYHYYLHGPLKRIELGNKLQGIDFVYNINGWLTQINHPEALSDPGHDGSGNDFRLDAFGMKLDYYESSITNLFLSSSGTGISPMHRQFGNAVDAGKASPIVQTNNRLIELTQDIYRQNKVVSNKAEN